ncbi:pirin [Neoasaia chiangmaiensis NBRC 101099]|uniref:Quercetin 2,3-dioxygenase n=1 Tax=Neoasaia chiangmaiensis TaxID=320497 RepID=A0A1U9KQH9_9PROT|nr:pirin family protein [Neoasaia chiangmaiensis]AQS88046.1 quercetin 2,3-dioxygenase [Neoasaia chiangmaiensis]GBR38792.1 pirin [Neoasaia chiangmaiensis NBRC 101099]GEN15720.1 quercetin 2,3-dioxygenase [Neoasaia chiangmaiensis]
MQKKILGRYGNDRGHWVGDGFPVRSLFSYNTFGEHLSPFLLLDYAGPHVFRPTESRRGVGEHPHKGFETVTIVYDGELEHRDSSGGGGVIGPGDVQWMTAGNGILHEEFHSAAYARTGGEFRMVQLWVNLPAKDKGTPAAYQTLHAAEIPAVSLPDDAGRLRIVAGSYAGRQGPARIFSPLNVWDGTLHEGAQVTLELPEGHNTAIVSLEGRLIVNGVEELDNAQFALLGRDGTAVTLQAAQAASFLVLTGAPLNEPIAGHGPFVMNTREEIRQAIEDFSNGRFGHMTAA